jgi:hypothetical protein
MLFGETVAVYCENHTEHRDTLCGQNAEFWYVKVSGAYSLFERCILIKTTPLVKFHGTTRTIQHTNTLERSTKLRDVTSGPRT